MSENICICGHAENLHEASSPNFLKKGFHKMALNCDCEDFHKQPTKKVIFTELKRAKKTGWHTHKLERIEGDDYIYEYCRYDETWENWHTLSDGFNELQKQTGQAICDCACHKLTDNEAHWLRASFQKTQPQNPE